MGRHMTRFLFKASDAILSHCTCENEPAMSTCQLDCPWCGCGWLISCSKCGKAFTLGEIRETDLNLEELGRREAESRELSGITEDDVKQWALGMAEAFEPFDVGDVVVYLDGAYWTIDSEEVEFDGYFASHKFDRLPHAEALENPAVLDKILGNPDYWFERELPDRH